MDRRSEVSGYRIGAGDYGVRGRVAAGRGAGRRRWGEGVMGVGVRFRVVVGRSAFLDDRVDPRGKQEDAGRKSQPPAY